MELARLGRDIIRQTDDAVHSIRRLGSEARGPVSVGLPPSLSLLLSIPLAETIQNEHPDIRLRISESLSGHILNWVNSGELDFGCVYEIPDGGQIASTPLLEEELFLITAPDNWPSKIVHGIAVDSLKLADLETLPLVIPSWPHGARKIIESFARANGIHLNIIMEIDSLPQIMGMVDRASAYTIAPHAAVMHQVAAGSLALVRIVEPSIRRTAFLVRNRARAISCASVTVETVILGIIKEMIERFNLEASLPNGAQECSIKQKSQTEPGAL